MTSILTDKARSMVYCKKGLKGILKNDTNFLDFIPIYYTTHIVHRHLIANFFKYDHMMDVVLYIPIYIYIYVHPSKKNTLSV